MSVSREIQDYIHLQFVLVSREERLTWMAENLDRLAQLGALFALKGNLDSREREIFEQAVEVVVRVEGMDAGRRVGVARMFPKPG